MSFGEAPPYYCTSVKEQRLRGIALLNSTTGGEMLEN